MAALESEQRRHWRSRPPVGASSLLAAALHHWMSSLRHIMWNYVGLVRTRRRLLRASEALRNLEVEVERFYRAAAVTDDGRVPATATPVPICIVVVRSAASANMA